MPPLAIALGILLTVVAPAACEHGNASAPPVPPRAAHGITSPELQAAVDAWREDDDVGPLQRYLEQHRDDESLGVWREVVALHDYDRARPIIDEQRRTASPAQLGRIAERYPDTIAGQLSAATLLSDVVDALYREPAGPLVIDFLDGGTAWCHAREDAKGGHGAACREAQAIRRSHAVTVQRRLSSALQADGCAATMATCNWWIARYPDAPETAAIVAASREVWQRRAHPHWQGGEHARCALRCAKTCRERATPLDDGCYDPCYAGC